ncbi:MAG TPA: hypothetical protein VFZ48_01380 [Candidatus Saccharimonadales bacterium]
MSLTWYGNFILELHPVGCQEVGEDIFKAMTTNYKERLRTFMARFPDLPAHAQLCYMLVELFNHGAIEVCQISQRKRLELTLSRKDGHGNTLDANQALGHFAQELFLLSGQGAPVAQQGSIGWQGRGRLSSSDCLAGIAGIFDAVSDGRFVFVEPEL